MGYTGPKNIVVLGGGLAGLAAADAITRALDAHPGPLPDGLSVTLLEATDHVAGRVSSTVLDAAAHAEHPNAPFGASTPHGLHFVWGSYAHLARLLDPAGPPLSPPVGTSTYATWLAPPDVPGKDARVVSVHVCDPSRPRAAWQPRARRVLAAFAEERPVAKLLESVVSHLLDLHVVFDDLLSYMDILFDEENLSAELRWTLFLSAAVFGTLGAPETSKLLTQVLDGVSPADADIGALEHPLFRSQVLARLLRAGKMLAPLGPLSHLEAAIDHGLDGVDAFRKALLGVFAGTPLAGVAHLGDVAGDDLRAVIDVAMLLTRDAARVGPTAVTYDPQTSGYLKNILKAAFSSPYGLDVGTSLRDAQFGVRRYEGAVLQLFDGDDSAAVFDAIRARLQARFSSGKFAGGVRLGTIAKALAVTGESVTSVDVTTSATTLPAGVPTVRPMQPGPTTETLPADAVVSSLLPRILRGIVAGAPPAASSFLDDVEVLGGFMNETINLQLFFPRRLALPFPAMPAGASEVPPFGISNLEGPFTIVVDLARGWSRERFEAIRLDAASSGPFTGTAWELVGHYPDLYTHDRLADPGRYQWPLAAQEQLAALLHDPNDFEPGLTDARPWVHDADAPGRLAPVVLGEVRAENAAAYDAKWRTQATPIIVAETLRQLAAMPGLERATATYLLEQAQLVEAGGAHETRWVLVRNCHAENRFFSAEPGLYRRRPHARWETPIRGLWVAGDWTRNGLNLQAMEAAVISGLQAACGVLEAMRGGGLAGLALPTVDPDILPPGAWDVGVEP